MPTANRSSERSFRSWRKYFAAIPRPIVFLGFTSLFTDVSSEIIYPLLPIFLTSVLGATPLFIGLIEGIAEATASILKFLSGTLSDRSHRKDRFVLNGYTVSTFARPLIGFATAPWHVLVLRFIDRVGKGIRTAPRDAWIASLCTEQNRGRMFSFHRAMDHAGAIGGPLLASLYLLLFPHSYRTLFVCALLPGLISLLFIHKARALQGGAIIVEEKRAAAPPSIATLPLTFYRFLAIFLLFTLANSSDALLLLRLKELNVPDAAIPLLWSGLHVTRVLSSFAAGPLSDRYGHAPIVSLGWVWYALIYVVLGTEVSALVGSICFLLYGCYNGLTEGPERAIVASLVPEAIRGKAFGLYHLSAGLGALPATLLFGYLWNVFGAVIPFFLSAVLTLTAALLLGLGRERKKIA